MEIEENWDKVKKITLDTEEAATTDSLAPLLSSLPLELRPDMESFIQACYEARPQAPVHFGPCISFKFIPDMDKVTGFPPPSTLISCIHVRSMQS